MKADDCTGKDCTHCAALRDVLSPPLPSVDSLTHKQLESLVVLRFGTRRNQWED